MMKRIEDIRIRNPFYHPLVTELIEDPTRYGKVFSQQILVGETLAVYQAANVVCLGPQGSGKSMILNLIRYPVISQWLKAHGRPPEPIKRMGPFLGISINLVRAAFHAFGRRSVSKIRSAGKVDQEIDAICAGDFLNHYLFREFLKGVQLLATPDGESLRQWMRIRQNKLDLEKIAREISSWGCWFGYYEDCCSIDSLLGKCEDRLNTWRSFLCANIDDIPEDVWRTKSMLGEAQHAMGNLLREMGTSSKPLSLFVVIDQYEVLRELNPTYGKSLQRLVNTLIKARDPVVFYKFGARTYDWGTELRIFGAESRIEVQRDYIQIDLAQILMRNEDGSGWLFPDFCLDVAYKRLRKEGGFRASKDQVKKMVGEWQAEKEASLYIKEPKRKSIVLKKLNNKIKGRIETLCAPETSPLELRLAGAWVLQKQQRNIEESVILNELGSYPWQMNKSWRKERVGVALLQIASIANQKPRFFGWNTILYLSGANISAFLLICSKIWDVAAKMGFQPLSESPIRVQDQSEGIYLASEEWFHRDRNEHSGGRQRYEVISRLGPSIHDALVGDLAISNPGYSGFSLRESDFGNIEEGRKVERYLENAVSWAILEERPHTSKFHEGARRRKWYLHPLLSPIFGIPYKRVKEPLYTDIKMVYAWIFESAKIKFGLTHRKRKAKVEHQGQLLFEEIE
jgi:hypothetical protein